MNVTLMSYTQNAQYHLIFAKQTRLEMKPDLLGSIMQMTGEEVEKELEYISNTIASSWEFVDYTFLIQDVTRAFTHQFVRNRHGSYAQQTMRMLDKKEFDYLSGPTINNVEREIMYISTMQTIQIHYDRLIDMGASVEDARGILPTNICTNILAKFNLRTLSEMMMARSSSRVQGEYRDVLELMYDAVIEVHPWAHHFLNSKKKQAADKLDSAVKSMEYPVEAEANLIKQIDILRKP